MRGEVQTGAPERRKASSAATTSALARRYGDAIRAADSSAANAAALAGFEEGLSITQIYARVIQPAMYWIGDLWRDGSITVGDEHLATAITENVLACLYPRALEQGAKGGRGKVVLAAVEGEEHILGLRMTADTLAARGHEVLYLGANVPVAAIVEAVEREKAVAVALSVTLAENASGVRKTVEALSGQAVRLAIGGQASSSALRDCSVEAYSSLDLLPDVDKLPLAVNVNPFRNSLSMTYRRDQADGPVRFPDEGGAAEAALAKVVSQTADMVRAAVPRGSSEPGPGAGRVEASAPSQRRSDLQVVADLFAAIDAKDEAGALERVHPGVCWFPSVWSGAGAFRGRQGVQDWFAQFGPNLKHLNIDFVEIRRGKATTDGAWIAVLGTVHDTRDGQPFSVQVGWRFAVREGSVVEALSYSTWQEALDAAGCGPVESTSQSEVDSVR